ncbi:fluoride efflux transporter FluC [Litorihabitans aurantiacus]|uniref:Fluoride ion transporter CrcB n=1 Tax=Litorihabitans aurantiacus TaxID=1930061 RepID=A0AA37USQ2_9MICO|nr:hypothetical protein [Litorihabitans aurantiacus]GMA30087.1 hypothetical protein GCM10025875_00790 [Litorihabitans aurantiacus]
MLGGFTTYSAYALDTVTTARTGSGADVALAAAYLVLSVVGGVTLARVGLRLGDGRGSDPDERDDDADTGASTGEIPARAGNGTHETSEVAGATGHRTVADRDSARPALDTEPGPV